MVTEKAVAEAQDGLIHWQRPGMLATIGCRDEAAAEGLEPEPGPGPGP
jgi:hypothetical protein